MKIKEGDVVRHVLTGITMYVNRIQDGYVICNYKMNGMYITEAYPFGYLEVIDVEGESVAKKDSYGSGQTHHLTITYYNPEDGYKEQEGDVFKDRIPYQQRLKVKAASEHLARLKILRQFIDQGYQVKCIESNVQEV